MRDRSLATVCVACRRRRSASSSARVVILSMSFAAAFGFLAAMPQPAANYDPHMFAIGVAALFGAACGAIGLLFSRMRSLKSELRALQQRAEELADRNWELKEAEERAKSFLAAQGDVIVRRDADGRITYVNDAFCALAGAHARRACRHDVHLPVLEQGATAHSPTAPASTTRRSRPTPARAGSPGAR